MSVALLLSEVSYLTVCGRRRRRIIIRRFRKDQLRSVVRELIPFETLSRPELNPFKLAYKPSGPDGRLV